MRLFLLTATTVLFLAPSSSAEFAAHPESLSVFATNSGVPTSVFPKSWIENKAAIKWVSTAEKSLTKGEITWIPEDLLDVIGANVTSAELVLDEMERTVSELENLKGVNTLISGSHVQLPSASVICKAYWPGSLFIEVWVSATYCVQTKKYEEATRWLELGHRVNRLYVSIATDREIFYGCCLIQRRLFAIQCEVFQREQASAVVCNVTYPRLPDNQKFLLEIARLQLEVLRQDAASMSDVKTVARIDTAERILVELGRRSKEKDSEFLKTFQQRLLAAQRAGESEYLPLISELMELRRSFNLVVETQTLMCKVSKLHNLEAVKEMVAAHSADEGLLHTGFQARVVVENGAAFLETQVDQVSSDPQPLNYPTTNRMKDRWRVRILK